MRKIILILVFILTIGSFELIADNQEKPAKGQLLPAKEIVRSSKRQTTKDRTVIFEEDFESGSGAWTLTGEWEVGSPTSGPNSGHSSSNCAGTDLDGDYSNNAEYSIISPQINLGQATELKLRFWEWFEMESSCDYGYVKITTDNGMTWLDLYSITGSGDWRQTEVNLISYIEETVQIAFYFTSDYSITHAGWYIDNIEIVNEEPVPLEAYMVNLNSQQFPFVYMNVAVDSMGIGTPNLTQTNFSVYENDVLQSDYFEVTPPSQGSGSRLTDIVFVMDNSGSMDDEQNAVENNVIDFVDNLALNGIDFALGLCRFGQSNTSGAPYIEDNGVLTTDADYFKNDVWQRNVTTGGHEPGYDAIVESANSFGFRPGSQRIIIIIGDEEADQGSNTEQDATDACLANSITLFSLTDPGYFFYYDNLIAATNGACFDIYSNFDDILDCITSQVANTYLIRYKSSDPDLNGLLRNVRVEVNYYGEYAEATGSYTPGATPQIERTQNTLDLHDQAWAEYTEFNIQAEITDDIQPFVQEATVFYKKTTDAVYNSVQMNQTTQQNIWEATISNSDVETPGLDYYISATDGQSTSSDPSSEPSINPYQLAILPNEAPLITHIPVSVLTPGSGIDIDAEIIDDTNQLTSAVLYYRKTGQLTYQYIDMINIYSDNYQAEIPSTYATTDGIDYFLKAMDDFGVASFDATPDNPHKIFTPGSTLIIKDATANNDLITNTEFTIYEVDSSNPTEQILKGNLFTNNNGELELPGNWFNTGDWVKVSKLLHTESTVKPNHEEVDNVIYTIELNNLSYDSNSNEQFLELNAVSNYEVILQNVQMKFNLTVSVEWDSSDPYLENLETSFRLASNYLYDVSDGQLMFDKIAIYDNKQNWSSCDMKIFATNTLNPKAKVAGIFSNLGHIYFPRKWFGSKDKTRNDSYSEDPLVLDESNNFRTYVHEFGHYALKFYDEYINKNGVKVHKDYNYGFMDYQYDGLGDQYSSEMSSITRYPSSSYQDTKQYQKRGMPCWEYLQDQYENEYNGILCPITIPEERTGFTIPFTGPDSDIGSLLDCKIFDDDNNCFQYNLECVDSSGNPVDKATVTMERFGHPWFMKEGETSDNGKIRNLGVKLYDVVTVLKFDWLNSYINVYTINNNNRDEVIQLELIEGDFDTMVSLEYASESDFTLSLVNENNLSFVDEIEVIDDNGNSQSYFLNNNTTYIDDLSNQTQIKLNLRDMQMNEFSLFVNYIEYLHIPSDGLEMISKDGSFHLDTNLGNQYNKVIINKSSFPPIRNGLSEDTEQAGNCYSISSYPFIDEVFDSNVKLSYSDSDIVNNLESSIRIFRWSEEDNLWQVIGGEVDTLRNEISCQIEQLGIYGAFTTKITPPTGGSLDTDKVYIYPNPFNPDLELGTIRFILSEDAEVTISIYDITGHLVRTLIEEEEQNAETEISVEWDGKTDDGEIVVNGVYFYVIESSEDEKAVGKAAVLR